MADWLPSPLKNAKKLGVDFSQSLYPYEDKMNIKNFFSCRIQNYHLSTTAISALMGHIDHVALLVNLKPAIEKNIWFSFCVPIGKDLKKLFYIL